MLTKDFMHGVPRDERFGCQVLWLISFIACLPAALLARLTGWRWQPWPSNPGGFKSVAREADSTAKAIVCRVYSSY